MHFTHTSMTGRLAGSFVCNNKLSLDSPDFGRSDVQNLAPLPGG